jgi:predicted nicotinamide N-methyase
VLELGAGCGLAGIAIATCTRAASVCISDFPTETMRNMMHNIALNCEHVPCPDSSPPVEVVGAEPGAVLPSERTFRSKSGCSVTVAQLDWEVEATWPRSTATTNEGPAFMQYDVIVAADLLPRESYGKSLAVVVQGLLKPGGVLIAVTPAVREGLPVLDAALRGTGYTVEEEVVCDEWRANPLRTPAQVAEGGLVVPPQHAHWFGGVACPSLPPSVLPAALLRAGCEGPSLRLVTDDEATDMFPELTRPSYDILAVTFSLPRLPA